MKAVYIEEFGGTEKMKIGTSAHYSRGNIAQQAKALSELEKAGVDIIWVAESYSFDAVSALILNRILDAVIVAGKTESRWVDVHRCDRRARKSSKLER